MNGLSFDLICGEERSTWDGEGNGFIAGTWMERAQSGLARWITTV